MKSKAAPAPKRDIKYTDASRGKLIVKSGFKGYDVTVNPYVGCEFGCKYCYVRFFVKDKEKPWGEFVRRRMHIAQKLPKEAPKHAGKRIVLGTMTDVYQPVEKQARLTRLTLQILKTKGSFGKIGIFTRSPIITDDIELIASLPKARVHFTISPYEDAVVKMLEPIGISMVRRWRTIQELKDAGIRVHVNVAPAIPFLSDGLTESIAQKMAEIGVDEFFVDSMQAYGESFIATEEGLKDHPDWPKIKKTMEDKHGAYLTWKAKYHKDWDAAWKKYGSSNTLPIWSDHENKVWQKLVTGEQMDHNK